MGEDPRSTPPQEAVLASDWSAQEAADLARLLASTAPQHGYEKAGGFWWASDGEVIHHIFVRRRSAAGAWLALLAAPALVAIGWRVRRRKRPTTERR